MTFTDFYEEQRPPCYQDKKHLDNVLILLLTSYWQEKVEGQVKGKVKELVNSTRVLRMKNNNTRTEENCKSTWQLIIPWILEQEAYQAYP